MAISALSRVDQGPHISAARLRQAIEACRRDGMVSPLEPRCVLICDLGAEYNVDPILFAGIANFESHFGMYPGNSIYDPTTGIGSYNWCSISNAAYGGKAVDGSRWGQYPDFEAGICAFYRLIAEEYYPNGQLTVGDIMWGVGGSILTDGTHAYAPPSDDNSPGYFANLFAYMSQWADIDDSPLPVPDMFDCEVLRKPLDRLWELAQVLRQWDHAETGAEVEALVVRIKGAAGFKD